MRRHFVVATFAAFWVAGEPQCGPEAGAVLWADPDRLDGLALTRGLAPVLRAAARMAEGQR